MRNLKLLLIFPMLICIGGCFAAAVGAGAVGAGSVIYYQGQLKTEEIASLEQTWTAVLMAMDQMGFYVVEEDKGGTYANLTARTKEDKKIRIKLKRENETRTHMTIRTGVFGDEDASRVIMSNIHRQLY